MDITEEEFKENLEFFLNSKTPFKGLSKRYIIECCLNKDIQSSWQPKVGDIIVGETANIFVISGHHHLVESIGGDMYFFGGGLCNRDGGCFMDSTYCFTINRSGVKYGIDGKPEQDCYHSSFSKFRYVPYPHELPKSAQFINSYL